MGLLSTVVCNLKYVDFLLKITFSCNLLCVWFPDSPTSSPTQILTYSYSFSHQRTIRNFKNNCTEIALWDINSPKTPIKFTLFYPFTARHGDSLIGICISTVSPLEINSFWLGLMTFVYFLSQCWDPIWVDSCRPCTCCHIRYKFMCVLVLSC